MPQAPSLSEILERSHRPSFIRGLRIEEVSGVDHPAHEQEGWTVLKAKKLKSQIVLQHELLDYAVTKAANEKRFTFGLLYSASAPGAIVEDAHGESVDAETLYTARLNYVRTGDRAIHLQHGLTTAGLIKVGEYIDLVQWPDSVEASFQLPNGKTTKATIPANSVWMGVVWNDVGWKLVKLGQLRGLSLGGYRRKAEETNMAEIIEDSLEGYTLKGVKKALPDGTPSKTNTGDADKPLRNPPKAPVIPGSTFGPAKPRGPMDGVTVIDHRPRLDRRFQEFLRGLEETVQPDVYRRMLEIIVEFNERSLTIVDQAGHIASLKRLASDLRKIMFNDHDIVQILRMGRFVLPEEVMDNLPETPKVPHGLGSTLKQKIRQGLNQNALSDFTGESKDLSRGPYKSGPVME